MSTPHRRGIARRNSNEASPHRLVRPRPDRGSDEHPPHRHLGERHRAAVPGVRQRRGPGFRTNIGLVELSPANNTLPPTTARIRIVDQDHHVVEVLDGGLIGAYATLTDNITNDTTYLGSQLTAKPN